MEKTFVCLEDYEEAAKSTLKDSIWNFVTNGACLCRTAKDNVEAYKTFVCKCRLQEASPLYPQISHTSTSSV